MNWMKMGNLYFEYRPRRGGGGGGGGGGGRGGEREREKPVLCCVRH
jgi:hypothetical protein